MLSLPPFSDFFKALWGYQPFPWQLRLADDLAKDCWPQWLTLPTGMGKTSIIDAAVYVLAQQAHLPAAQRTAPLRIVFAVNRRIVVDEAFDRARAIAVKLKEALKNPADPLHPVAKALHHLSGDEAAPPLEAYPLRGATYTDQAWTRGITQPSVITTTLDQLGSRLLFRGYGCSEGARPIHAALLTHDALLLLDEAHTSKAFSETLTAIQEWREEAAQVLKFPFKVMQLTATPPEGAEKPFELDDADRRNEKIKDRLKASKPTALLTVSGAKGKERHHKLALACQESVLKMLASSPAAAAEPERDLFVHEAPRTKTPKNSPVRRVLIVVNRVATAEAIRAALAGKDSAKAHGCAVEMLTGLLRPLDRDLIIEKLVETHELQSAKPSPEVPRLILIATQCIEVGADFDFDALITELAPLDCLRQRFGRLNRYGRDFVASAVILAPEEALAPPPIAELQGKILSHLKLIRDYKPPDKKGAKKAGKKKSAEQPPNKKLWVQVSNQKVADDLCQWLSERAEGKIKALFEKWKNVKLAIAKDSVHESSDADQNLVRIHLIASGQEAPPEYASIEVNFPPLPVLEDPIYGNCLPAVWAWLNQHQAGLDFGLAALDAIKPAPSDLASLLGPVPQAPILLPAHLDLLCQTSPAPQYEPDPSLYIHGPARDFPEIGVVLRGDIGDESMAQEILKALPPLTTEAARAPLYLARKWLAGEIEPDDADAPKTMAKEKWDKGQAIARAVYRYAAGKVSRLASANDLRPGDVLILPAQSEKLDSLLSGLTEEGGPLDQLERAYLLAKDKVLLRLGKNELSAQRARLDEPLQAEWDELFRELTSAESTEKEEGCAVPFLPALWKKLLPGLIRFLRDNLPPTEPLKHMADKVPAKATWKIEPHPLGGVIAKCQKRSGHTNWPLEPDALGHQGNHVLSSRPIDLKDHQQGVTRRVDKSCLLLGLSEETRRVLLDAAISHDVGKADPRFQGWLYGTAVWGALGKPLLAKSSYPPHLREHFRLLSATPRGFRHELLSTLIVGASSLAASHPDRELLLHLIASHHGGCRAFAPVVFDESPGDFAVKIGDETLAYQGRDNPLASLAEGVATRFWSLTRKYGWWGLAYLEAFLRLADQRESAVPSTPENS